MNKAPTTLIIMDGFGLSNDTVGNAVRAANTLNGHAAGDARAVLCADQRAEVRRNRSCGRVSRAGCAVQFFQISAVPPP